MSELKIADALELAVQKLKQHDIENTRLDARLLLEHVLGVTHEKLLLQKQALLTTDNALAYQQLIDRRCQHEPIAKLIGKKDFWKAEFYTNAFTLDPRPDSETLIELVLESIPDQTKNYKMLDFGTGTGCLLLSLLQEYPYAQGVGVDVSQDALNVAEANCKNLKLTDRAQFIQSVWGEQIAGKFDVIISNPPYIESEVIKNLAPDVRDFDPMLALDGGEDGYDDYRKIAPYCATLLEKDGVVFFEIGQGQEKKLEAIMAQHGFYLCASKKDIAGIIRVLAFKL